MNHHVLFFCLFYSGLALTNNGRFRELQTYSSVWLEYSVRREWYVWLEKWNRNQIKEGPVCHAGVFGFVIQKPVETL